MKSWISCFIKEIYLFDDFIEEKENFDKAWSLKPAVFPEHFVYRLGFFAVQNVHLVTITHKIKTSEDPVSVKEKGRVNKLHGSLAQSTQYFH